MAGDVAPFPWDALDRTTVGLARAGELGAALLQVDFDQAAGQVRSTLGSLGIALEELELAAVAVHRGATFAPDVGDALATSVRWPGVGSAAAVAVDRALAGVVVGAVLEADAVDSPIDEYDFGLFSFALLKVASSLREVGLPALIVDVERRPTTRVAEDAAGPHPIHEYGFRARLDGTTGWVRLFVPEPIRRCLLSVASRRPPAPTGAAARVRLRFDVGVGRVSLRGTELRSLGPGDVVFLSEAALDEFGSAPARLWIAERAWVRGTLAHDERWTVTLTNLTLFTHEESTMEESGSADTAETTQLVEQASVSLEAVVGRVELSLDRLARLKPGEVLTCDGPVGQPVDLVANGTTIATGELVDIEGRLGVRVLSLSR